VSCSFYLYRFRKYVSYGFPIINFCTARVHYETPCICDVMHCDGSTNAVMCEWETWTVLEQHDISSVAGCRLTVYSCNTDEEENG
jgi:hypothetical protein